MIRFVLSAFCIPLVVAACGGTASIEVNASSSSALALSAEEAAADPAGSADPAQGVPATTSGLDAVVLHVLQVEAKVVVPGGGSPDAEGEEGADSDAPSGENGAASEEADAGASADDSDEDHSGWSVISEGPRDVDLLELAAAPSALASGTLPAGKLTQLRLVLDPQAHGELVVTGVATPIRVPSGSTSGLKVLLAPPLPLDSIAAASVGLELGGTVSRGDGEFLLQPTLRVSSRGSADGSADGNSSDEPSDDS